MLKKPLSIGDYWEDQGLSFWGSSISGIRTAISLPQLSLCLDLGQALPPLFPLRHFFISHAHQDHAGGIPYLISQKKMTQQDPPIFYIPSEMAPYLSEIIQLWAKMEGHQYDFHYQILGPEKEFPIHAHHVLRPFPSCHRISSFGCTLIEKRKKLKREFQGCDQNQIRELKSSGIEFQMEVETPVLSYSGDTRYEYLLEHPQVRKSKILLTECTYLDNRKSVEHAREWGHTHLDELLPLLDEIESETICLIHISNRYSDFEIRKILQERIPKGHQGRIRFFPGR